VRLVIFLRGVRIELEFVGVSPRARKRNLNGEGARACVVGGDGSCVGAGGGESMDCRARQVE
jgi:hypothetical protein